MIGAMRCTRKKADRLQNVFNEAKEFWQVDFRTCRTRTMWCLGVIEHVYACPFGPCNCAQRSSIVPNYRVESSSISSHEFKRYLCLSLGAERVDVAIS